MKTRDQMSNNGLSERDAYGGIARVGPSEFVVSPVQNSYFVNGTDSSVDVYNEQISESEALNLRGAIRRDWR